MKLVLAEISMGVVSSEVATLWGICDLNNSNKFLKFISKYS